MEHLPIVHLNNNSPPLQVEYVLLPQLKRSARSPRIHPEKQIVMLRAILTPSGFWCRASLMRKTGF